jgi:DNA adenine methylase
MILLAALLCNYGRGKCLIDIGTEGLRCLKGKFILSLNDHPEVRQLFRSFHIRKESIVYTAQKRAGPRVLELLICNFAPT